MTVQEYLRTYSCPYISITFLLHICWSGVQSQFLERTENYLSKAFSLIKIASERQLENIALNVEEKVPKAKCVQWMMIHDI